MTTPQRLLDAVAAVPNLPGRVELLALCGKLATGCRSELELWGHDHVFRGRGMPRFQWQVPIDLDDRRIYLDLLAEAEMVNVELDGAAWHGSPDQRERDARRDAALAARGFQVVRFTHRRLITEPQEVRRELLFILAGRDPGNGR